MDYEEMMHFSDTEESLENELLFEEEKLEHVLTELRLYCQENHLPLLNHQNTVLHFKEKLIINLTNTII